MPLITRRSFRAVLVGGSFAVVGLNSLQGCGGPSCEDDGPVTISSTIIVENAPTGARICDAKMTGVCCFSDGDGGCDFEKRTFLSFEPSGECSYGILQQTPDGSDGSLIDLDVGPCTLSVSKPGFHSATERVDVKNSMPCEPQIQSKYVIKLVPD